MVFVFLAQAIWKAAVLIQVSIEAIVCFLPGPIDRDSQEKNLERSTTEDVCARASQPRTPSDRLPHAWEFPWPIAPSAKSGSILTRSPYHFRSFYFILIWIAGRLVIVISSLA
jgi:hypothetical protein